MADDVPAWVPMVKAVRRAGLALAALLLPFSGCAADDPPGDSCASLSCDGDQRCLQDECRDPCVTQRDCPTGQNCAAWRFSDGSEGHYCVVLDYARDGGTGQFEDCDSDANCDTLRGFSCLEDECRLGCHSHFDCASIGSCQSIGNGTYCAPGDTYPSGQFYSSCPNGAEDCDGGAGFVCLGAGIGDLEAYCSTTCAEDDECPSGFQCVTQRGAPCETACGVQGSPREPDCIPTSEIGPGRDFDCGLFGVERQVCSRRRFCSPCETDADCLAVPGQICAKDESGAKICTVECDPNQDSCPWGSAAQCGSWDAERGISTCSHRFGACQGTGLSCEPCVRDSDCGGRGICNRLSFTGERYCIDLTVECDCAGSEDASGLCTGAGCPETPGGLRMVCIADNGVCYGASTSAALGASPQFGCWPR